MTKLKNLATCRMCLFVRANISKYYSTKTDNAAPISFKLQEKLFSEKID